MTWLLSERDVWMILLGKWFARIKELTADARLTEAEHGTLKALGEAREKQILARK